MFNAKPFTIDPQQRCCAYCDKPVGFVANRLTRKNKSDPCVVLLCDRDDDRLQFATDERNHTDASFADSTFDGKLPTHRINIAVAHFSCQNRRIKALRYTRDHCIRDNTEGDTVIHTEERSAIRKNRHVIRCALSGSLPNDDTDEFDNIVESDDSGDDYEEHQRTANLEVKSAPPHSAPDPDTDGSSVVVRPYQGTQVVLSPDSNRIIRLASLAKTETDLYLRSLSSSSDVTPNRANHSPYLRMLHDMYQHNFVAITVTPNEPWHNADLAPTTEKYQLRRYNDGSEHRLLRCVPSSFVLKLSTEKDDNGTFYDDVPAHHSWVRQSFINRFIVFHIGNISQTKKDALSKAMFAHIDAKLNSSTALISSFWIIDNVQTVAHTENRANETRDVKLVVYQEVRPNTGMSWKNDDTLPAMATEAWLTANHKALGFDVQETALLTMLVSTMHPHPVHIDSRQTVSCVRNHHLSHSLRVYINCSPQPYVYGFTYPNWALFRYKTLDGSKNPIPVIVDTIEWDQEQKFNWKTLRGQLCVDEDDAIDAVENPVATHVREKELVHGNSATNTEDASDDESEPDL